MYHGIHTAVWKEKWNIMIYILTWKDSHNINEKATCKTVYTVRLHERESEREKKVHKAKSLYMERRHKGLLFYILLSF